MAYSHSGQPRMLLYNFDEHMKAISIDNILIHDLVHGLHTIYIYILYVQIHLSQNHGFLEIPWLNLGLYININIYIYICRVTRFSPLLSRNRKWAQPAQYNRFVREWVKELG